MRSARPLALLVLACLWPATGAAQIVLTAGPGTLWATSPSAAVVFDDDRIATKRVQVSYRGLSIDPLRFGLEAGYEQAEDDGQLFEIFDVDLKVHGATIGACVQGELLRGSLRPFLRAGAAAHWAKLSMTELESDEALQDWAFAMAGDLLGGIELVIPPRFLGSRGLSGPLTFGVMIEGGYHFAGAHRFGAMRAEQDDDERIATQPADIGALDLDGPVLRGGVVFQF